MIKKKIDFIKKITEAHGPSGDEGEVRRIIKEELNNVVESIEYDNLGSIICRLSNKSKDPKIALVAHMDEVGFLVRDITKEGYLKLYKLGGINPLVAVNSEVTIKNIYGNKISGIIFADKNLKEIEIEDLFVDIGCSNRDEVKELGIKIGDSITFSRKTEFLNDSNNIVAKSWDDRVGCILGIELLKALKKEKISNDLYFVGSVQEEIGTKGGKTSMDLLNPDIAIILDVATGKDTPNEKLKSRVYGNGPCLVVADRFALGNRTLLNHFSSIGDENNIKYQFDFLKGGGTDNGPATLNRSGVPGLALVIPVRNCHTPNTILNKNDFNNALTLLKEAIKKIDSDFMEKIYHYKYE